MLLLRTTLQGTLTEFQAKGTNDGISVGQFVYNTTHSIMMFCVSADTATSVWAYRWQVRVSGAAPATNALRYLNWVDTAWSSTLTAAASQRLAKAAGAITSVTGWTTNDPGQTTVGFHLNENTTPVETESQTPSGAAVLTTYSFDASTYMAGDRLSISVDPTNDPGIQYWIVDGYEVPA